MDRKNIYIVILSITTIIAACIALYFGINSPVNSTDIKKENGTVSSNTSGLNTSNDVVSESISNSKDNAIKDSIVKDNNTMSLRVDINNGKCLNLKENFEYELYRSDSNLGIECRIVNNSVQVIFSDLDEIKSYYGTNIQASISKGIPVKIDNFSNKKVVDVYLKSMGQSVGNEVIFFLMEDGTVEYMPVRKALLNNDIKSYGKLEGLTDIVEIVSGKAEAKNGPGYRTPFAISKDGSYYELYTLVSELLK